VFHKELLWLMVIVGAVVEFPARLGRRAVSSDPSDGLSDRGLAP